MSHIFIEPGKNGKWKIMIEENGKERHLNDAVDQPEAVIKAQRTAAKRNLEFIGEGAGPAKVDLPEEVAAVLPEADPDEPSYMSVPKPRGAPNLGDYVTFNGPDEPIELLVVDYLAEQFVGLEDGGSQRIVHISEDWNIL